MRRSFSSDSAGWSGTFLAARDALAQVAAEANLAAAQLRGLVSVVPGSSPAAGASTTSANSVLSSSQASPASAAGSLGALRSRDPSLGESLPAELGSTMRNWNRLGDRSAQVLAAGWASGVHAVSVELTQAIFVTGQWGETFVRTGERIVQQLIEVAAQALIVRTLLSTGLGGFFGLANGISKLPGTARFASGGLNLDTIPALLSPGEAVLRSSAVAELGPSFIASLNAGVVDLNRLERSAPILPANFPLPQRPAGAGTSSQHFHFAFHDDGSAARRYLESVDGRKFLVDAGRQTVHEVTGRS